MPWQRERGSRCWPGHRPGTRTWTRSPSLRVGPDFDAIREWAAALYLGFAVICAHSTVLSSDEQGNDLPQHDHHDQHMQIKMGAQPDVQQQQTAKAASWMLHAKLEMVPPQALRAGFANLWARNLEDSEEFAGERRVCLSVSL